MDDSDEDEKELHRTPDTDDEDPKAGLEDRGGRVLYGGDGKDDAYHSDTERSYRPNNEIAMMGAQKRDVLIDSIERERLITCDCPDDVKLHCVCRQIYVEVAGGFSVDTKKQFRAVLKRYDANDKQRKKHHQVDVHVDNLHARDAPLAEWGDTAEPALLGMAFPHLFPYGRTCFVDPKRRNKWYNDDFAEWLGRLPWLTYTAPCKHTRV